MNVAGKPLDVPVFYGVGLMEPDGVSFASVPEWVTNDSAAGRSGVEIALQVWEGLRAAGVSDCYVVPPIRRSGAPGTTKWRRSFWSGRVDRFIRVIIIGQDVEHFRRQLYAVLLQQFDDTLAFFFATLSPAFTETFAQTLHETLAYPLVDAFLPAFAQAPARGLPAGLPFGLRADLRRGRLR